MLNLTDRQLDGLLPGLPGLLDPLPRRAPAPATAPYPLLLTPARAPHPPPLSRAGEQYRLPAAWLPAPAPAPPWFPALWFSSLLPVAARADATLTAQYADCVRTVVTSVLGSSSPPHHAPLSPGRVARLWQQLPASALPPGLDQLALQAWRCGVKLGLDRVLVGEEEDTVAALLELNTSWELCSSAGTEWEETVVREMEYLFSLEGGEEGGAAVRGRRLTLQHCSLAVARLNKEVARSLWASLSLELLYLTNDDEERYSIQAEERLLRNLTVQAADPPLGYAIFSSPPLTCTPITF